MWVMLKHKNQWVVLRKTQESIKSDGRSGNTIQY